MKSPIPTVVILGRPNVGKSSLFNKLLGRRRALVHDLPGVTRDRIEERPKWWHDGREIEVRLIDTGGLGAGTFRDEIKHQVDLALAEADVAVLLVDGRAGIMPEDHEVLLHLRKSGFKKPIALCVNKLDEPNMEDRALEFSRLGVDWVLPISAETGRGVPTLIEECLAKFDLPKRAPMTADEIEMERANKSTTESKRHNGIPKVAIIGKPNAGKSTLLNALSGKDRVITSSTPGTTVDSIDVDVVINGMPMTLIDTAGIRRKSKTEKGVEVLSVVQSRKTLDRCDVAILMIDGVDGISDQDEKIGGLIEEAGCGIIIAVNKWDQHEGITAFSSEDAAKRIRSQIRFLGYAPIIFISALEKKGLEAIGELAMEILAQQKVEIATKDFTEWVRRTSEVHNPKNAKFYMCHQASHKPPTFVCHVSDPRKVHFSLRRHLVNGMRERYGFLGSPIRLLFRKAEQSKR